MPELTNAASHKYWNDYKDPMIYQVVAFMEGVEDWTLDEAPDIEEAMQRMGEALENIGNIDLKKEDEFIKLSAYIKSARMLRLLQCLDTANPGAASKLLMHAEESSSSTNDIPGLFLRRNIVFERLRLLSRTFSPERLTLLTKALGGDENA
ncbi:MAG: type IVB secretion system protein IcmW [Gammaproteobacteria bacterium]|nr:type IVB secretion system protein IcmW [Gammaproteobacteria bacterium]